MILAVLALVALIVATVLCALAHRHPTLSWGCACGWLGLALVALAQIPGVH